MQFLDGPQADTPESLHEIRRALDELQTDGKLPDEMYFKGLVLLAYRWARLGDLGMAYSLVVIPPREYYRVAQVNQMDEDADYQEAAEALATALVQAGMVHLDQGPAPTQPPGRA